MQLYLITRADNEKYVGITNRGLARRAWEHKNGYGSSYLKGTEFTIRELLVGPERLISLLEDYFIVAYSCSLNKIVGGKRGHGLQGSQNGTSKLIEGDIQKIIDLYTNGKTQQEIADIYNVSRSSIREITSGNGWKHVPRVTPVSKRTTVEIDSRDKIRLLWGQGLTNIEIGKALNIKYATIYSYTKDLPLVDKNQRNTRKIDNETIAKILVLSKEGINSSKIAKQLGIGRTTVNRYIAGERT